MRDTKLWILIFACYRGYSYWSPSPLPSCIELPLRQALPATSRFCMDFEAKSSAKPSLSAIATLSENGTNITVIDCQIIKWFHSGNFNLRSDEWLKAKFCQNICWDKIPEILFYFVALVLLQYPIIRDCRVNIGLIEDWLQFQPPLHPQTWTKAIAAKGRIGSSGGHYWRRGASLIEEPKRMLPQFFWARHYYSEAEAVGTLLSSGRGL